MEQEKFWIVVKLDFPTTITHKHASYECALKEAKRLARKNHEHTFVVMKTTVGFMFNDVVEVNFVNPIDNPF